MGEAKGIVLRPIDRRDADRLVKRVHYSGKVVNNSQIHIGVFYGGHLEGVMQFGPSLDKRKLVTLVEGTLWNEFIELNRMAFTDALPRNSESRALGIAMRILKKHAPHLQWVVTFADGTQCGDGTIYRAAGFVLTSIKKNDQIWEAPGAGYQSPLAASSSRRPGRDVLLGKIGPARRVLSRVTVEKGAYTARGTGSASMRPFIEAGYRPLAGHQLRYLYFLAPTARERLTVPILPYSEIEKRGAGMSRGVPARAKHPGDASGVQPEEGGSIPTRTLQPAHAS